MATAKNIKPTTKNSPKVVVGKNPNNKPAEAYAGRAKEGLADLAKRVNMSRVDTVDVSVGNLSKSAGNEAIKTTGIETRGNGAATKGRIARGPMA